MGSTSAPFSPRGILMGAVILVVDDELSVRRYIEHVLKARGHCVYVASTLDEAVSIAEEVGPHLELLICDLFLKHISGLEVTKAVAAICPQIQTILISGEFLPKDTAPLHADGITYRVLPKPFNAEQLLNAMALAINQRDSTASAESAT
jgi:DNA-binding NtrC family response regulator